MTAPVLTAKPSQRCTCCLLAWCVYCKRNHVHGAGGGPGHRSAHCAKPGSPFARSGYILRIEATR